VSKVIVDTEKALMKWLEGMPFLTDRLYFDFLGGHHGSCAVSPLSENAVVKRYINGDKIRQYTFALQVMLQVSDATDDVNTENMFALRKWQEWIEEQEAQKNYPNFGEKCSDYRVEYLDDMSNGEARYENGLAKLQFFAKIIYFEKGR
jgi:hypothetical protein